MFPVCLLFPCTKELVTRHCNEARGGISMLIWPEFLLCGLPDALVLYYWLICARIPFYFASILLLLSFLAYVLLQIFSES